MSDAVPSPSTSILAVVSLALGLLAAAPLYHDEHRHYPAAALPNPALPPEKRLSWLAALLPHLHLDLERRRAKEGITAPVRGGKARAAFQALHADLAWDAEENRPAVG